MLKRPVSAADEQRQIQAKGFMNASFTLVLVGLTVAVSARILGGGVVTPCAAAGPLATGVASGVGIEGNHPSAADLEVLGEVPADQGLDITVFLAPRNQAELGQLLAAQQDPSSPHYHHWLTPKEYAARFGPREADLRAVAQWLRAEGFEIVRAEAGDAYVRASGNVGQAKHAFGVKILLTRDGRHFFNTSDPSVPAQFAGIISHIHGLDNVHAATPLIHKVPPRGRAKSSRIEPASGFFQSFRLAALLDLGIGTSADKLAAPRASPQFEENFYIGFGVNDLYEFYDEGPLSSGGNDGGGGDCIALIEDSNYLSSAVDLFDTTFSLPALTPANIFPSADPGINGDEGEALLDIEWTHAVAPGAPISVYIGNPNKNLSGDPLVDAIAKAVHDNSCGAINIGFGFCSTSGSFYTSVLHPLFAQAASQGQSVFAAAGDQGAAGLVFAAAKHACVPGSSRNVSEMSADPNVTAVGGTEFTPNYDANGNDVGLVPEDAWNDSSRDVAGATGGGASAIFLKPFWQNSPTPADGARDVPDVGMVASWYSPGMWVGDDHSGSPRMSCCAGGTSVSTPVWAGIAKLISSHLIKSQGLSAFQARLGNINPKLYQLASSAFNSGGSSGLASIGLRDVTTGNNDWAPTGVAGYVAGPGYDQVSGWGTADIATFVTSFAAPPAPTATPTPGGTIALSPAQIAFGGFGDNAGQMTKPLMLTNKGNGNLVGTVRALASPFSASGATSFELAPGEADIVSVVFAPTQPGKVAQTLVVTSSDPAHPTMNVAVSGKGLPPKMVIPTTLTLPTAVVAAQQTTTKTFNVKNAGAGLLNVALENTLAPPFSLETPAPGGYALTKGQSLPVTVSFQPSAPGKFVGTLTLTSDDPKHAFVNVTVKGTGK